MSTVDFTWLIGGPQGSGVESGANIFSRVCAEMGYQVFGKREFYSNIKGEHSYFTVRIADKKIHSNVNDVKDVKEKNAFGVILGKALYENKISIEDAKKIA